MTTSSLTTRRSNMATGLDLIEVKPGLRFSKGTLKELLPNAETVLFFGKVYELDYVQLSNLMRQVLESDVADALFSGNHSTELQAYLIGEYDEYGNWHDGIVPPAERGNVVIDPEVPHGEILPEVWKSLEVEVATSVKKVADKLSTVVSHLPGKQGEMMFNAMMVMNRKRPTIGDYRAKIHHARTKQNLVIFDVSGSMSEHTVRTIVDDVVAMSYMADAGLAIVSNTCTYWEPGAFDSAAVLARAEFGGTHYETLADLLQADWGTVVTIADYDSSPAAYSHLAKCHGQIVEVLDSSLVNRPTHLARCVGQLADKVRPLLIGGGTRVLT